MRKTSKKLRQSLALVLAFSMLLTLGISNITIASAANTTTYLTQNGETLAQILVAENASDMEKLAAEELQYHAKLVSGATLPVTTMSSSGDGIAASFIADTITTEANTWHYPVEILLENPTSAAVTLTIAQVNAAEGMAVSFRGMDGMADGQVTVAAGTNMLVSGVATITNAHTFQQTTMQVAVSDENAAIATLDLNVTGTRTHIGTALDEGFDAGNSNWTAIAGETIVPSQPDAPVASATVSVDATVGNTAPGSLKIEGEIEANYGSDLALTTGNLYKLTFAAKADAATQIYANVADLGTVTPYSLHSAVDVTGEWATYEFRFVANISTEAGYTGSKLNFATTGGTVWIDDVTLVNCGVASASLLDNSSFENGAVWPWYAEDITSSSTDAYTGNGAMALSTVWWNMGYDFGFSGAAENTYTISCWLKNVGETKSFDIKPSEQSAEQSATTGNYTVHSSKMVVPTDEWARYELTFTTQSDTEAFWFNDQPDTTGLIIDNFTFINTTAANTATGVVLTSDFATADGWNLGGTTESAPGFATEGEMSVDPTVKYNGAASLKLSANVTADNGVAMPMITGNLYRLGFWVKADTAKELTVKVGDYDTAGAAIKNSLYTPVSVTNAWKYHEFRFVGNISEAASYAYSLLALSTTGEGSIWIDDIKVVDCGVASASLMLNSGFEDGVVGGWYSDVATSSSSAYTGQKAMELLTVNWNMGYEGYLNATPGHTYTVSCWMKNIGETVYVDIKPSENSSTTGEYVIHSSMTVVPTDEWTRYELTFTAKNDTAGFWFNYQPDTTGLLIDNFTFIDTTAANTADGTIPPVELPDELPAAPEAPAPAAPNQSIVVATTDSMPELATMFPDHYAALNDDDGFDGFAIDEQGGIIYIWGTTEKGVLNGVYDFIEENMGVIWMRAEDTAYTPNSSIEVIKTGYMEESPFEIRGWHLCGNGDENQFHSDPETEIMMSRNKLNAKFAEFGNQDLWQWQLSVGITPFNLGHGITDWVSSSPIYDRNDPLYWNTDEEGNPVAADGYHQVNFWYDKTATTIAAGVNKFLDENPYVKYVGIGINDNGYTTTRPFDQKKYNFVTGEVVEDDVPYDPETMVRPEDADYVSTVFFCMMNKIARAVKAEHPDAVVNTYAYLFTETPPRCDVEDNICVVFAPLSEDLSKPYNYGGGANKLIYENLEEWRITKTTNIAFYNYYGCFPYASKEYERPIAERIQQDLQYYAKSGFTGLIPEGIVDAASYKDDWAMNSLTLWLYSKLAWNPYEDIDALTEQFCKAVYGDAAEEMMEYYGLLKQGWDAGAEDALLNWAINARSYYDAFVLGPGLAEEIQDALDRAWNAADDLGKSRIRYIKEAFETALRTYSSITVEDGSAIKTTADKDTILSTFDMTDPIWADAPVLDNFSDAFTLAPIEGAPTKVRLLWDEEYLYVAYENFDTNIENLVTCDTLDSSGGWWVDLSCDVETFITADKGQILYGYFGNPDNLHFRYSNAGETKFDTPEDLDFDSAAKIFNEEGIYNDRWVVIQAISFDSLGITEPATTETEIFAYFYRCHYFDSVNFYNVGWNGAPVWNTPFLKPIELVGEDGVSKSALQSLVNANADLVESEYTSETWIAFQTAMTNANAVLANDAATQEQVDAAKAALSAAIAGLTKTAPITSTTTEAKVDETLSDEKKAEIEEAIGETTITAGASGLHTDAGDIADSVTETKDTVITTENGEEKTAETVVSELADANNDMTAVGETNPVEIAVVTYLDVKVTDATTTEDGKVSITVDITPMAQTVATTKEVLDSDADISYGEASGNNAVAIGEPEEIKNVTADVEITLAIPASMAIEDQNGGYKPLYVTHVKDNGSSYIYEATVSEDNGTYFATFTNTNGFSKFTLLATNPTVATIGSKNYGNLQSAVNDVKDNETITIAEGNHDASDLTAVVTRPVSFTVANGSSCSITAGANLQISWNGTTCTVTTATVTPPAPTTYAVTLVPNGGTINAGLVTSYTYGVGAVLPTDVTQPGFIFGGWYATPDLSGEPVTVISDTDSGNKVFYAKWIYNTPFFGETTTPEVPSVDPDDILAAILPFSDVANTSWYYNDVYYVWQNGLMNGTGNGRFSPGANLNRAMLVTTLYRLAGEPNVTSSTSFTDLPNGQWYTNAMKWAVENDIIRGYGDNTCKPLAEITHEQVIAVLHRYAKLMGKEGKTNGSTAGFDFSSWAKADVQWANANGLLTGFKTDISDLTETANRAEIAVYLHRFAEFIK